MTIRRGAAVGDMQLPLTSTTKPNNQYIITMQFGLNANLAGMYTIPNQDTNGSDNDEDYSLRMQHPDLIALSTWIEIITT